MFERAVIRGLANDFDVDLGLVAETLLFYREVHLAFDFGSLTGFLRRIGYETAIELLRLPHVTATYTPELVGVHTDTSSGIPVHNFSQFRLAADASGKRYGPRDLLHRSIAQGTGFKSSSRRVQQLGRKIRLHQLPTGSESVPTAALNALRDPAFVQRIPAVLIPEIVAGFTLPSDHRFEVAISGERFTVNSDIDFKHLSDIYKKFDDTLGDVNAQLLLATVVNAQCDTHFAASHLGELVTSGKNSSVIRRMILDLVRKREESIEQKDLFDDLVLQETRSVRQAINSGERSFSEFLELLEKAEQFREWVHGQPYEAKLAHSYVQELSNTSWISELPARAARFAFFTGIGFLAGPGGAIALNAFDSFVLEKLAGGWNPSQFVMGPLRQFTEAP